MANEPETLQDAIIYFADANNCLTFLADRRWPDGVFCPRCGSKNVGFIKSRKLWQCKDRSHPKAQFSIKVGTIFEDSAIGLDKWLTAMWMLANCKNGVSSHELARTIGVTQKSAWFMLHRLRLALQGESGGKLSGEVEVDESFIGGKSRNMHKSKRKDRITGTGGKDKATVIGVLKRGGEVRTAVVPNRKAATVHPQVKDNVEAGSELFTDSMAGYRGLGADYDHQVIDHAIAYVDGNVHTNCMENYWSLLKRGLHGTYVSVEPFHLFRYLDEQAFRYNSRKKDDGEPLPDLERFKLASSRIAGKRLTYAEVTGKAGEKPTAA